MRFFVDGFRKIWGLLYDVFIMPFIRGQYGFLGKNSYIRKPLMIIGKKNIFIGEHVFVRNGARIETVSQWYDMQSFTPKVIIGDNVSIEQRLHLTCAESVEIEDNVVISYDVLITDINHSYENIDQHCFRQPLEVKPVKIKEYSLIGAGARILPGVTIGKNVIVGTNSVVTKSVPDYSIVAGIPAKIIKQYDFDKQKWKSV